MAKFCVYCGAPLEETSGQCPLCEREQPNLSEPKPMVWPTVEAVKPPEPPKQEPFAHAQEWLSQESPVWQTDIEDEQKPEQEKAPEETKVASQPIQEREQADEKPQVMSEDICETKNIEPEEPQAEQAEEPEGLGDLFSLKEKEKPITVSQDEQEEKTADEILKVFCDENDDEKTPEKEMICEDAQIEESEKHSEQNIETRLSAEGQKAREIPQTESDEARHIQYENTFSEILQDFSSEQKQEPVPPQPKYLPAATYEERPEPTTAGILGTLVLSMIPVVGWILLLVWAFDGQAAVFQKRLARALLLFKLIVWLILLIAGALTAYISYEIIRMSAYSAFAFSGMT